MEKIDIGHWEFPFNFDPTEWIGFVYKITCIDTNRKYIGKKFFFMTTRKKIKNRTNRKKVINESNWKKYTGSCKTLNEEITLRGKDKFRFEILSLHESRSSLAWREVELIVTNDALRKKMPDGTSEFWNGLCPPIKFIVKKETEKELQYRI